MSPSLDLILALGRAQARVARRLGALAAHGLGTTEFVVLLQLHGADEGRLRRLELARALHLTPSGVTRVLAPLEKIGLVARESSPVDARLAFAVLTDAGRRVVAEARATAEQVADDVLTGLRADDAAQLTALLEQVAA